MRSDCKSDRTARTACKSDRTSTKGRMAETDKPLLVEKGLVCRMIIKYVVNVLDGYAALLVLLVLPGRTEVLPRFSQPGGGIVPLPV